MRHTQYNTLNTKSGRRATSHGLRTKAGVTLLEMVVVVAIVVILATLVIGIATNIDNQSRKQLTKSTLAILNSALQQFQDYGYRYKADPFYISGKYEREFYLSLEFPLDCNLMPVAYIKPILENVLSTETMRTNVEIESAGDYDPNCSGSAILYYFLSRVPQCRQTLDRIDGSLITNKGSNGGNMIITVTSLSGEQQYPFFRILDAWQNPLRYDYYDEDYYYDTSSAVRFLSMRKSIRTFPLITSAGPDKEFDTADDITNR